MNTSDLMRRLADVEDRQSELVDKIGLLQQELDALRQESRKLKSILFIKENGITKDNVELLTGVGMPHFGHIDSFVKWLKTDSKKPWAEWNGQIHRTSDLVDGRWSKITANVEHLF